MESTLIQRFDELPSAAEFEALIESRNVPAIFSGCIKDWRAFCRWNPSNGGLQYLQERVGSCTVEAMLTRSAPVFYGDIRNHERVPIPFSSFIRFCKQRMQMKDNNEGHGIEFGNGDSLVSDAEQACSTSGYPPQHTYLAQVPIVSIEKKGTARLQILSEDISTPTILDSKKVASMNLWMNSSEARSSTHYDPHHNLLCIVPIVSIEKKGTAQLQILSEDISTPTILDSKKVASMNLWMNSSEARSSTHYDPHHNLLCIVSGCKKVFLWSPSASDVLYPMPIYGEASNHSSVPLESPKFSIYPRAKCLMEYCQAVTLQAGDALFIPEGWFHQVDSAELTIAVNFWWQSNIMSNMSEHMDSYYLRRIMRRLTDKEMNEMVCMPASTDFGRSEGKIQELACDGNGDHGHGNLDEADWKKDSKSSRSVHDLEPVVLHALHELVSLVHEHVNVGQSESEASSSGDNSKNCPVVKLEDDPVAKVLCALKPHALQNMFLAMVEYFPRTLEGLILHVLSPVGAEIVTRKFEELDEQTSEEDRNKFYEKFYGVFDDQFAAMDAILNGKEIFASQAFKNVLDKYLGVKMDSRSNVQL